jgi:hypothetical protein
MPAIGRIRGRGPGKLSGREILRSEATEEVNHGDGEEE